MEIIGRFEGRAEEVLNEEALALVEALHREFEPTRRALLRARDERQQRISAGELPNFLDATATVRSGDWTVSPVPGDIQDRRVEITGPAERKMVINALNSGARVFMADFEDANTPTWSNMVQGQVNLVDAVRRAIEFAGPDGRDYRLNENVATLFVRPRGWHLPERHVLVDGEPVAGAIFDFAVFLANNVREQLDRGTGPYFYVAKLESHLEARLWNDVFCFAQDRLGIPRGTIKATVLIETILAAFEMDEILYELRDHSAGLNAGRWDYLFSIIKKFRERPEFVLPDRAQVTMTVPFMRAYAQLLVKTCHRRGTHAMGGMAAFVPSRRDPEVNETALAKVREDKLRESGDGFDGTWVAHPDLVTAAMEPFDSVLGDRPNQVDRRRDDVAAAAGDLLDVHVPDGSVTEAGLRNNVSVALQYLASWLSGTGAVAIFNLMEDAATAEIARSQIWQWIRNDAKLDDGQPVTRELVGAIEAEELDRLRESMGSAFGDFRFDDARSLFERVALSEDFEEFLTLPALELLD